MPVEDDVIAALLSDPSAADAGLSEIFSDSAALLSDPSAADAGLSEIFSDRPVLSPCGNEEELSEIFGDLPALPPNTAVVSLDAVENLPEVTAETDAESVFSDAIWESFTGALLGALDVCLEENPLDDYLEESAVDDYLEENKDIDVELDQQHIVALPTEGKLDSGEVKPAVDDVNGKDEKGDAEGKEDVKNQNTIFKVWDLDTTLLVNDFEDSDLIKQLKKVLSGNNQGPSTSVDGAALEDIDDLITSIGDLSLDHFNKERRER